MTQHVVLVGLSGTGKTSVGRRIAALVARPFVDADDEIEERTGRTVRGIFAADGEAGFREIEAKVMADLLGATEPTVIAAGGGAVVTESTRRLLRQPEVFVVWLTATPAFLASRMTKKRHRPLLDDDPIGSLTRLLDERAAWYAEVADVVFDVQPAHHAAPKPEAKANIARALTALVRDREAPRTRDHVVLVGPMGSGKSTVGLLVAARMGRPFFDSDEQIEATTGLSAREIASRWGIAELHRLELDALRVALVAPTPSVVAAAGSVVDHAEGQIALQSARAVVSLRIDPQLAAARRTSGSHRPAVPTAVLAGHDTRYESVATASVDVDHLDAEAVADHVLATIAVAP